MDASESENSTMATGNTKQELSEDEEMSEEDVSDEEGEDDEDEDDDCEDGNEEDGEDWETDDNEDEEEEEADILLEHSESDGDEGDNCPICLNRFRDQDIGTPEACDHCFCLECLQEWSKTVNTCPVDRQVFHLILCKHAGEDKIYKRIPVEDHDDQADGANEDDVTFCEVCHQCDREDRLLLCDGCDLGYHLDCLNPPLSSVPVDEWFCPDCASRGEVLSEEVREELDEAVNELRRPRRQVPRTLAFERVRFAIEEIRVRRSRRIRRLVSSSEDESAEPSEEEVETTAAATTAVPAEAQKKSPIKRKTPKKYRRRKKTTKRRRKTTKRKTPKKGKRRVKKGGKKRRTVKGRRKIKRTARTARPLPVTTPKSRIAGALGLVNPPKGCTIPLQKMAGEKSIEMKKSDIGATSLSIFGCRDELVHFQDDDSMEPGPSKSSSGRVSKYSRSALSSYRPIGRVPNIKPLAKKEKPSIPVVAAPVGNIGGPLDLLGAIMEGQSKLHLQSKDITINRDGTLTAKQREESMKSKTKHSDSNITDGTSNTRDLASSSGTENTNKNFLQEKYDPFHPTDELEDLCSDGIRSVLKTQESEEYDPFHPTGDMEHDDSSNAMVVDPRGNTSGDTSVSENVHNVEINRSGSSEIDVNDSKTEQEISFKDIPDNPLVECSTPLRDERSPKFSTDEEEECSEGFEENLSETVVQDSVADGDSKESLKNKDSIDRENTDDNKNKTNVGESVNAEPTSEGDLQSLEMSSSLGEINVTAQSQSDIFESSTDNDKTIHESPNKSTEISEVKELKDGAEKKKPVESTSVSEKKDKTSKSPKKSPEKPLVMFKIKSKEIRVQEISEPLKTVVSHKKKEETTQRPVKPDWQKRRRGEIDFTEDVTFSESGFPENFEVKIPAISNREEKPSKMDDSTKKVEKISSVNETDRSEKENSADKNTEDFKIKIHLDNSDSKEKIFDEDSSVKERRKSSIEEGVIDDNEKDKTAKKPSGRDRKKSDSETYAREEKWEGEVEEGEVEEEGGHKERKKKDRYKEKRKKSSENLGKDEEDKHYSKKDREEEVLPRDKPVSSKMKSDSSVNDTRIVIQVTQDTEDRTVWAGTERIQKKLKSELKEKEKEADKRRSENESKMKEKDSKREKEKDRKHRRYRSRSRSRERKERSRSRERGRRSKSRERSRRRHRDRSHSKSRERSLERSHKKKRKDRDRSRERDRERDRDRDRDRERHRSREQSSDKKDMFGRDKSRSHSPYHRLETEKERNKETAQYNKPSSQDVFPLNRQETGEFKVTEPPLPPKRTLEETPQNIEPIETKRIKYDSMGMENSANEFGGSAEERDEDYDDEPEESEQFHYTDRDEYLLEDRQKQQQGNLITLGVNVHGDYDPSNPTDTSSPAPGDVPPLPPPVIGEQFLGNRFPPPGMVPIQERPPVPVQASGPPGQGILGDGTLLIQGPPPPREPGPPPPGLIPPGPSITLPMGINVLPPGFHQGLPQTLPPQRQLIMNPFVNRPPGPYGRIQRLPGAVPGSVPGTVPRFGWQVTSAEMVSMQNQFGPRMPPGRLPGPQVINGTFEPGLPPPPDAPPPFPNQQILPSPGEPRPPVVPDGPPPHLAPVPHELEEGRVMVTQGPPPPHDPMMQHPHDPRHVIPLQHIPTSEPPPPISLITSLPALGLQPGSTSIPVVSNVITSAAPPPPMSQSSETVAPALVQLEEISKLLSTQARLAMLQAQSKNKPTNGSPDSNNSADKDEGVFKVPQAPIPKAAGNSSVSVATSSSEVESMETTEVVDMDMSSPLDDEGNIELPLSPQFDNLIDKTDDEKEKKQNETKKDSSTKDHSTSSKKRDLKKDSESKNSNDKSKRSHHRKHHGKDHHHHRHHRDRSKDKNDLGLKALNDAHNDLDAQEVPSSAVEMTNKEKYLKKLHLQERVVEEVKMAIKPHYANKKIDKEQYKEILRKAVPKICHSKSGDINPMKIKSLVEAYVEKYSHTKGGHSSVHKQKTSPSVKANGERVSAAKPNR